MTAKKETNLILENIGYAFIFLGTDEYIYMNSEKIYYTYDGEIDILNDAIDADGITWAAFDKILEKVKIARDSLSQIIINKTAGIEFNGKIYATIKLPCQTIILITAEGIGVGSDDNYDLPDDELNAITHSWKKFDEIMKLINQYRKANVKSNKKG